MDLNSLDIKRFSILMKNEDKIIHYTLEVDQQETTIFSILQKREKGMYLIQNSIKDVNVLVYQIEKNLSTFDYDLEVEQ